MCVHDLARRLRKCPPLASERPVPATAPQVLRVWTTAAAILTVCGDSGLAAGARIPLRVVAEVVLPNPTTPASIEAASIAGDTLRMHVSYAGGCGGKHEFGLVAQRGLLQTTPPQVILVLRHESGDPCRAGLAADVEADLRPLQTLLSEGPALIVRLYEPQAATPVDALLEYSF
jgi:hypothetical protein